MAGIFDGKSILITGGTGSFGKKCVEVLVRDYSPERVIVFSRDELKQVEMAARYETLVCGSSSAMYGTNSACTGRSTEWTLSFTPPP